MKNIIRILSFVLALLMLSSAFVGCGKKEDPQGGGNNPGGNGNNNNTLEGVNWDGAEYRILGHKADDRGFYDVEVDYDEIPEDVVGQAVWNRNSTIKEKYGLDVVGTLTTEAVHTEARVFIGARDDQYDLIICENDQLLGMAKEENFLNINKLNYIDFTKDCWNDKINEQFTYGDKMYYTSNKFLIQEKHRTWMIWYNRTLAQQLNVGYLEDEVFAGTWTMDRVIEIARETSSEYDGLDGMTSGDRWGFVSSDPYTFGQLAYGCGFRLSDKGADGYPVLVGATDQVMAILDKIFVLSKSQTTSFFSEFRPTSDENIPEMGEKIFKEGRAVLMGHCVSYIDNLDKLNFKYGVLPNPKYTVEQADYYSMPNWRHGHLFAVPATVNDIEKAGFGLQAISEESVDTSYKAYIDTRCKKQDSEDPDMARCLGIIFDGVVWDVAFIDDLGGVGQIMRRELLQSGSNTFVRLFDKKSKRAKSELAKIKTEYQKHDAS